VVEIVGRRWINLTDLKPDVDQIAASPDGITELGHP
jgi:hypothetical protein